MEPEVSLPFLQEPSLGLYFKWYPVHLLVSCLFLVRFSYASLCSVYLVIISIFKRRRVQGWNSNINYSFNIFRCSSVILGNRMDCHLAKDLIKEKWSRNQVAVFWAPEKCQTKFPFVYDEDWYSIFFTGDMNSCLEMWTEHPDIMPKRVLYKSILN
jgi:hypothetical protein